MPKIIDKTYLPFTAEQLRPHFIADVEGQLEYYQKSAARFQDFMNKHKNKTAGIPLKKAQLPRQIEKDERFWTVTALKHVFDDPKRDSILSELLTVTYGERLPIADMDSWQECLSGDLRLYFEARLPSPPEYVEWLRSNLPSRQTIPYVLDAAHRDNARTLEGPTHVDAMFLNTSNGFAWLIEAKVLSDVSSSTSFDNYRNQIVRNLDVMLYNGSQPGAGLETRDPEKSLFALLTPNGFRDYPSARLYGLLLEDYRKDSKTLERDLPHRTDTDWERLSRRIGWVTFDDVESCRLDSCPWLPQRIDTT